MSERIEVGDLVRVVRNCECDPMYAYGWIFTVEDIVPATNCPCRRCGSFLPRGTPSAFGHVPERAGYHPIAWLRKIPPLTELQERREEIEA